MWKPESATLVEDWKPSSATLVDDWRPTSATEVDELSVEPSDEDIEKYRKMGVKEYRSPSGKLYDLTEPEAVGEPPDHTYFTKEKIPQLGLGLPSLSSEDVKKTHQTLEGSYSDFSGIVLYKGKPVDEFEFDRMQSQVRSNPQYFSDLHKRQLAMIENSLHPLTKELPQKLKWLSTSLAARIPGFARMLGAPNLRQDLAEEAKEFPGWSGQLAENAADAGWFYIKYLMLLPKVIGAGKEKLAALKNLPRVKKVIDTIEKAGGAKWLAERFPRTVGGVESALETFGATVGIVGPIEAVEAWGENKTLEEAWPEIRNSTLIYAGITTTFDVGSSIDRAWYIKQLKAQLRKTTSLRYKAQGDALAARLKAGERVGDSIKGLADSKRLAYKTIDKLCSNLEAEMAGISRSDVYKQNELVRESALKSAERFAKYGLRAKGVVTRPYKPYMPKKPPTIGEQIPTTRAGEIVESIREIARPTAKRPPSAVELGIKPGMRIPSPPPTAEIPPAIPSQAAEIAGMASELTAVQRPAMAEAKRPPTVAKPTPVRPVEAITPAEPTVTEGKVADLSKRADVAFKQNDLDAMHAIVQESWELPESPEAKALVRRIQILDGEMVARQRTLTAKPPAAPEAKPAVEEGKILKEIAYDLGEYYSRIPANATNKKAADKVLDAMIEIKKGNNEQAVELLDKAMGFTLKGYKRVQAKAGGRGAGPVQEKEATSNQRTADTIYRIAQGLKKDIAPAAPEAKPAVEEVVETDEKLSGITKRRRTRLIKETAEEIKQDDIYQSELEAIGYKEGEVGVGFYYVPEKFRSEVEDITGKAKGFPTKLQRMFTFNPQEGATDWTKAFWKEIEAEGDVRGEYVDMDISDFVRRVKDSLEERETVGGLNARALEGTRKSRRQNPYTNYKITKFEMLRDGYSADEIDDMTLQWAEEYGIDLDTLDTEWVGAEPRKLKDIKQITDETKQDEALEVLARENILKQERTEAKNTVREVLKANDVEVEVKEVEEIEPEDEIPFEVRGRPTGAAITQGEREVVLLAYGADSRTGYHEGYHIMRRRLTERDTKVLDKYFKGDEEAEARSFAEFAKTNKTKPFLRGVWQKLINILRRIKSSLQGRGYRSVEDIFGEIQRGKIAKGARVPGVAYDTGVFGQPIEEQLRLPFKERQAAIKKVVLQEAKAKIAKRKGVAAKPIILSGYPEVEYKFTGEWRRMELGGQSRVARRNRAIAEVPVYKSDEGKTLFDASQQVVIKPYRRGRKAEPPTKKPYEEWRPKGRVPIKAKLIKEVDAEIARTMKPRSNTVQTTPEEIDRKLSGLFGTADLFYNPTNSLPEIQEAFAQLVRGGPLFDIRYEIKEPVFYSKLQRTIEEKMPPAMQADQMRNWLKKQGIKDEEMEWSGLDAYIDYVLTEGKTKADRRVTKQQALDTIAANNIQIEEVEKLAKRPVKGVPFVKETDETKFRQYTLPGGEDYKELLLRLPLPEAEKYTVKKSGSGWAVFNPNDAKVSSVLNKEAAEEQAHHLSSTALRTRGYKTAHWEETNVLAHVRMNDRTDSEGNKVLFIEEIQSDWHQKGRKRGYKKKERTVPPLKIVEWEHSWVAVGKTDGLHWGEVGKGVVATKEEAEKYLTKYIAEREAEAAKTYGGVPDAPFKKTWQDLALKRMLRYAAENGYDKIAWTTGEQQAERYDLSKSIESVNVIKGKRGISLTVTTKEGKNVIDSKLVQPNELDNIIGKELADKIRQQKEPEYTYSGLDLKVGGEGMKSFYDRMIPQFLNKYTKKWGGRVGQTTLEIPGGVSKLPWQVYADNELYDAFRSKEQAKEFITGSEGQTNVAGEEIKWSLVYEAEAVPETVPSLTLTPSIKKAVLGSQVMFEIPTHKLIADVYRKARVKAEKARLKAIIKPRKKGLKRIKLKIRDVTPVLREDMKPLEVPPAKEPLKGSRKPPYFSDAWYEENIKKQRTDWLRKLGSAGRRAFLTGEKILTSSSTRLYNIHPELFRQTRRYIYDVLTRTAAMNDVMQPFLRGARRMNKIDRKQLDLAFKNSDRRKITELVVKHKLENEYAQARDVLDEIFDTAKEVGIDIEYQRDYWHRHIKDPQGFLEYFQKGDDWSIIDQAIRRRAKQAGRKAEELTDDEKAQVVNTLIRGFRTQALILSRPGAAKERTVDVVWKDIDQFYDGFETSILKYIRLMNAKIAEREFFGRETKEIQDLRKTQSARLTRLIKLKKRKGLRPDIKEPEYKEHISKTYGDWQAGNERLERLTARSPKDTIGGYVYDLVRQGQIQPSQERQIQDILTGIFAPKRMGWGMGLVSTGIYLDTLNSPIQALTQLDEFAYAFYRSPLHSIPVAIRTAFRMSKIKPEDIGIKSIGVEFHDPSMKKALTLLLKSTGFELVDRLNKENYINTILNKYQAQARSKTEKPALVKRLARVFGKDYKSVLEDLKKPIKSLDDVSDNVKYLLLNEILDIQPVAISEMPEAYNKAGNLRILYTLKTFYIKRLDFMRNECFKDMKSPKTFLRGFSKLVWLAFSFALFGAGSDFLKDWVKGRTFDLMDSLVDNMLRMVMSSKFQVTQTQKEGFGRAVLEQWVPPTKIVDEISKDVITVAKGKDRGFEIWRSVPLVGELYYWWFGRGREKIEAKEGKKIGSRPTKPTKPIELRKPTRPTR